MSPDEVPVKAPEEAEGWYLLWQGERKRTLLSKCKAYLSDPWAPWQQFRLYFQRPWRKRRTLVHVYRRGDSEAPTYLHEPADICKENM